MKICVSLLGDILQLMRATQDRVPTALIVSSKMQVTMFVVCLSTLYLVHMVMHTVSCQRWWLISFELFLSEFVKSTRSISEHCGFHV